jgi:electron transport complex protein RnfC
MTSNLHLIHSTRTWPLIGGVHPPENKTQSLQLPLGQVSLPETLIFPLNQHIGAPAEPIVRVGERVLAGQCIAAAKGVISANIHASTSGTVIAIEDRPLPHPSALTGPCIVLQADGRDEWIALNPCADYTTLEHRELLERIRAAGITGMGGAGFPAAVKLNPKANHPIHTLIINGTECEPYITADDILMQTGAEAVIAGTRLLAHLLNNPRRVIIGIEDNKPAALAAVSTAARDSGIEVVSFPTKYPSGGEKQLIQILTGQEVPSGQLPASIGIVVQNVGSAVAVWEAIRYGKPLVERITTVVGDALQTQRNVRVRLGTPIRHVLDAHGFDQRQAHRLIMGGPMMGFALLDQDVPVVKSTNCILAPSRAEIPDPVPAQACIRCGLCAEACPASLLPQQLYWYARAEDQERLQSHNLMDCIECGACSFVCPSNIPLVQYYRAAKGLIRQEAADKEKSDRSRRRFEFRQERIAKEEAEKEAKRLARKQAAEEAKLKLQSAPAATPDAEPAAATTASVPGKAVAPAEQQAKLERLLASAQSRLSVARQKFADAETDEQRDKCAARIKEAELKLQEAEAKLAAFNAAAPQAGSSPQPDSAAALVDPSDPVAAAIARAQAKMALPPDAKLRANLESLQQRLLKADEKLSAARAEGAATVDALQAGADKLREKIAGLEADIAALPVPDPAPVTAPEPAPAAEQDAAQAAIERARAKAAAQASMSPQDKLRDQLESLHKRLDKARERLQQAETDGDANIDAFRSGVSKLEAKLAETQQQLETGA